MRAAHGADYQAFSLFGPTHLFWLGLCVALCVIGSIVFRRLDEKGRRRMVVVIAALLVADELFKDVLMLSTGQFEWEHLPFHLCGLNIFVSAWYAIHPNDTAAEILYALSLPGAMVALLVPNWTCLPITCLMHIHSETVHIMLVLLPVLLLAGGFRPNWRRLPRVFAFVLAGLAVAVLLNGQLGTNFMFMSHDEGNPVLVLIYGIFGPAHGLGLALLLVIVWALMYTPWIIADRRAKSKQAQAS